MYTTTMTQPDPELFMNQFLSWEVATKENKWQGRNITRWQNKEYDETYKAAADRARPGQAGRACSSSCNDMVVDDQVVIPVVARPARRGAWRNKLHGRSSAAGTTTSGTCQNWYKEA